MEMINNLDKVSYRW